MENGDKIDAYPEEITMNALRRFLELLKDLKPMADILGDECMRECTKKIIRECEEQYHYEMETTDWNQSASFDAAS